MVSAPPSVKPGQLALGTLAEARQRRRNPGVSVKNGGVSVIQGHSPGE
jgi:hypothetical protein